MARMGEDKRDGDKRNGQGLDTGGFLARVRRIADLSQRELAGEAGVGQSTIARWEAGGATITAAMLERILALAGLRLEVVDGSGQVIHPMDPGAVRDNAGRRFPAHLDVVPPERRPSNRGAGQRYDRPDPQGWYALRPTRDHEVASGAERPAEHPTRAGRGWARRVRRPLE
jgi:transcriptional regulator with XRE-family HTH domain